MKREQDSRRQRFILLLLLCGIFLFAGCSKEDLAEKPKEDQGSVQDVQTSSEQEPSTKSIYQVGDTPKNYTFRGMDGLTYSLEDYRDKAVLLVFWSVDCEFCVIELEAAQKAYKKEQGYEIFAINATFEDSLERAKKEVERMGLTFPIPLMESKEDVQIAVDYDVTMIPHNVFLDKKGVLRKVDVGEMSGEEVIKYLETLAEE